MQRRMAQLPLHTGKAPAWLFQRMHRMAGAVVQLIVADRGADEMLERLADPWWFQAFGCVLGFDWHSSGLTTVTCGALKEAYGRLGDELGIHVAGGKGATSRRTPDQLAAIADRHGLDGDKLIYASRMSAKVDSAAVQDGYQIYAHSFFCSDEGAWCVVQQGMSQRSQYARRYHWLSEAIESGSGGFVCEPHSAIAATAQVTGQLMLNMVAAEAGRSREATAGLARAHPDELLRELGSGASLFLPNRHRVLAGDVDTARLARIQRVTHEQSPATFEALLGVRGVGPKAIRSLALIAELIYDAPVSRRDPASHVLAATPPATFSYAHGGKDGHPFPVDRSLYDENIAILEQAVRRAKIAPAAKDGALHRLAVLVRQSGGRKRG